MVSLERISSLFIISVIFALFFQGTTARQSKYNRRKEAADDPSIDQSGWSVPLEGSETCTDATHCTNSLSPPPATSTLQYLAIGRGTITYTCAGQQNQQPPVYVDQNAFLYDAAALIGKFSSEEQFHSYIPRFLQYDYTSLDNSSLTCIGNVRRINEQTAFELYNVDAFVSEVQEVVNTPSDEKFDLQWAHSQDDDAEWDIYRVETSGGAPPYNCGDQIISDEILVGYVAEYWFYRKGASRRKGRREV